MTSTSASEKLISTNALLLFVLPTVGMIMVTGGSIAQYYSGGGLLFFSLLSALGPLVYIVLGQRGDERSDRRRFWWCLFVCSILVIGLTARQFSIRKSSEVAGIHDGAVQGEVAAAKLVHGENPYGADYRSTPYEVLNPPIPGGPAINVVWSHFIYPPLIFLLYVPLYIVRAFLGPLADYRIITVGALGGVAALLITVASTWTNRTRATLLTLGNPLLWMYAIIGTNDIVAAFWLIAATLLVIRRRWWWSGILFGLAVATKQSVWPLAPLWACWFWYSTQGAPDATTARRQALFGLLTSLAFVFGPFLIWHPARIIQDLVRYASGSIPYSYPISGTTFLQYLTVFHFVESPWSIIPTYVFQLVVGLPVLSYAWWWIRRDTSPIRWLTVAGIFLMVILLFSRYFNNNYYIVPMTLFVAAHLLSENEERKIV